MTIVALLINPNNPESVRQPAELQEAVRVIGLQLVVLTATNAGDIEAAFMAMVQNRVGALRKRCCQAAALSAADT